MPFGIWSFFGVSPTFIISFPVDNIETIGFLETDNQVWPVIAMEPMCRDLITIPSLKRISFFLKSKPFFLTNWFFLILIFVSTYFLFDEFLTSSWIITVSLPEGNFAPVKILTVSSPSIFFENEFPAEDSPITFSFLGVSLFIFV